MHAKLPEQCSSGFQEWVLLSLREHLDMPGDIFGCVNWGMKYFWLGTLLSILQGIGQPPSPKN